LLCPTQLPATVWTARQPPAYRNDIACETNIKKHPLKGHPEVLPFHILPLTNVLSGDDRSLSGCSRAARSACRGRAA
jgi:hypothetical protein